ncbi:hypothetical protein Krac_11778 [Ktedonobacter racemifer DSM 44963]|uniref:Uncharacterized protein n=1 Tax=Ktedonobacter racemifer DSM 44963 TaxID=485913 RepID=D6TDN8_KTERA|nr:hypothetical protein Krac_11778 [Ktedonobacter racemifer DSM 44963]
MTSQKDFAILISINKCKKNVSFSSSQSEDTAQCSPIIEPSEPVGVRAGIQLKQAFIASISQEKHRAASMLRLAVVVLLPLLCAS